MSGMPPLEAFAERSRQEPGEVFTNFRRWARKLPVWDLEAAGSRLDESRRRDIFSFLVRLSSRHIYKRQVREVLSMLLPLPSWVAGSMNVEALLQCLEADPSPSLPTSKESPTRGQDPPKTAKTAFEPQKTRPPLPTAPADKTAQAPCPQLVKTAPADLRARVEQALKGGISLASGKELVQLYKESCLGGGFSLSAKASDATFIKILMVLTTQRVRDLFVDALRAMSGGTRVHIPHLHIDLKPRKAYALPSEVQTSIERKITRLEKWTSWEKAHVLAARHEQTIRYVLAYAAARAKATGRVDAVWINLSMQTDAQGHANAVCMQAQEAKGAMKVFIYDPNFASGQEYWVHAKKAVNDAVPGVQKLLSGTGISIVGQAELFGHGLQTALGTTERHKGWFSSTVYTRHEGYPICGAIVHLLAVIWMAAGAGKVLSDVVQVEKALAEVVAEGNGKATVQSKVAALLKDLSQRHRDTGVASFANSMRSRFDADKHDWPGDMVRNGGSITVNLPGKPDYTYSW
eukprot:TRINITY_DN24870_c0_g1_i1.p1 TRINITY_DN24870_c0_g1~~TRINITY_DN24870_c0_g1_i1.p1  ORF type:complete len:518 (+),score=89.64 TRINITY_DN24870_c0_g1_i1:120-1673(+)